MTEFLLEKALLVLVSVFRLVPVFVASSLSPLARLPMTVRIISMLLLAVISISYIDQNQLNFSQMTAYSWFELIISELFLGLLFAFGLQTALAALLTLGRVVDMQIGFGAGGLFDPNTNSSESVIGMMLVMLVSLLFFVGQLHHDLISFLVFSYNIIPLGHSVFSLNIGLLIETISAHFLIALILLIPVIVTLLLVDALIAFSAKTMPQMNIYFVGLPVKIGAGLVALSTSIRYVMPSIESLFEETRNLWQSTVI